MPTYQITTKRSTHCNGVRIEPGMTVTVVTNSMASPINTNGGQVVIDAYMRIFGIYIKKAGCLNTFSLDCVRIG